MLSLLLLDSQTQDRRGLYNTTQNLGSCTSNTTHTFLASPIVRCLTICMENHCVWAFPHNWNFFTVSSRWKRAGKNGQPFPVFTNGFHPQKLPRRKCCYFSFYNHHPHLVAGFHSQQRRIHLFFLSLLKKCNTLKCTALGFSLLNKCWRAEYSLPHFRCWEGCWFCFSKGPIFHLECTAQSGTSFERG